MTDKTTVIEALCHVLEAGDLTTAAGMIKRDYPFAPGAITKRKYGQVESTRVFIRDGFIDRYSGDRLVYPPVLRFLSLALPADFPFHPNWRSDLTHPAFWELGATVDHVLPVARGGADDESNWVTTSMARNSAKANWTLDELGWVLHPPGSIGAWDGLLGWFRRHSKEHPELLTGSSLRAWYRAAGVCAAEAGLSMDPNE